jgi:hypothetical protein
MTHVGVLCNVDTERNPLQQLSASVVNRACLIGRLLADDGLQLFLYCPKDLDATGEVPGYVLADRQLTAARRAVPRVNANWSYRTRQLLRRGMGYQPFKRWMRDGGHEVYVPYDFSELVSNKQKAFEEVRSLDPLLHPHTEDFAATPAQIESFLARSRCAFLKPRAGHKGNRVFVLRRSGPGYALEYYDSRARRTFPCLSLAAILALVESAASRERYVIQEGIESLRHQGGAFDVRVVMVNDGHAWHALLESRLAPPGSELSNVHQGGSIHVTRELLEAAVGGQEGRVIEERVRQISDRVARHFETRFPDALPEIGLDFVLGPDRAPRLVEINAKPGIAGIGSETKLFDWTPGDQALHEMWTFPHMRHLAGFLRHKVGAS